MPVISGSNKKSGAINLSGRLQLRNLDNQLGSYPTILKTGDTNFKGNKLINFNDTNTIFFKENELICYPNLLEPNNNFISFSLATPNSSSDIKTIGTVRKGISDKFVIFDNSEKIGPFIEHQRVTPNSNNFYLTGTDPSVLPGFSNRLSSKTIIKIPINVKNKSSIFWSTGTLPDAGGINPGGLAGGVNSGISYFNFNSGIWEPIGVDSNSTTGSLVDYLNPDILIRSSSFLVDCSLNQSASIALSPGAFSPLKSISGKPITTFGFPSSKKFETNAGQTISLKDFINHPFVLEKVVFNWSGSLDLYPYNPQTGVANFDPDFISGSFPHRVTFGILNKFNNNLIKNYSTKALNYSNSAGFSMDDQFYSGSIQKDIIGFGRIQGLDSQFSTNDLNADDTCEFTFIRSTNGILPGGGITGSFNLEFEAKVQGEIPIGGSFYLPSHKNRKSNGIDVDRFVYTSYEGGRTGLGFDAYSSGRSLRIPFVGKQSFDSNEIPDSPGEAKFNSSDLREFISPYVLFPQDELIFFAFNQPKDLYETAFLGDSLEEKYANQFKWDFAPGEHYVLLFGSLIQDNKEYHDTSNQPLTSDSIHESLHFDNPTLDQFQVETIPIYSGSYIDDIVSGSFYENVRGVKASTAAGTQGIFGSLLKGVNITDSNERYYDTFLPNVFDLHQADGFTLDNIDNPNLTIINPTIAYTSKAAWENNVWHHSFPFESKYSLIERQDISGKYKKNVLNKIKITVQHTASFAGAPQGALTQTDDKVLDNIPSNGVDPILIQKFWFGVGDGNISYVNSSLQKPNVKLGKLPNIIAYDNAGYGEFDIESLRGFKYGIKNSSPEYTNIVMRYDRYGQFRDMLEQRKESAYFDNQKKSINYPIKNILVGFVSSSNKSVFSTSSLPYFDGESRN
jgi:hypothetical protein